MATYHSTDITIKGMDCAECTLHVKEALASVPGVISADVYLGAERATIRFSGEQPQPRDIEQAVKIAGYEAILDIENIPASQGPISFSSFGKTTILSFIGIVVFVLSATIIGEQLGLISSLENRAPWYFWLVLIMIGGYSIMIKVIRALFKRKIISHTLMTTSMITAIIAGEWTTALLIVIFMRLGDFIERNTTEKARQAVHSLRKAAPRSAHLVHPNGIKDIPISALSNGDIVQVKPGESIPVDGMVLEGSAIVDNSTISGESMPQEVGPGDMTYAASLLTTGSLRIKTTAAGKESLFGRIIKLVEEAEGNRGEMQTLADRFSAIYLPIVGFIALITFLISKNAIAAAAVMAVSCSCSFSLATPVAMLASIGRTAQEGLLFKGGKYIEEMVNIDTLLIDKTGTLTLGKPEITDMHVSDGFDRMTILKNIAAVEQDSEHPLADAIIRFAEEEKIAIPKSEDFSSDIGKGVSGIVDHTLVEIQNNPQQIGNSMQSIADKLLQEGKTIVYVHLDGRLAAILAAEDSLRIESKDAIDTLKNMGIDTMMIISGDHRTAVGKIAAQLEIDYSAEMLPHEKIDLVKEFQKSGRKVMMIGDGINDAPALAQAEIGVAMGAKGTEIAIETAHVVLLRDDWSLIPKAIDIAKRTMRIVRLNIFFTAIYNLFGISLAAFGILAPSIAAAMQSIPDVGIMANSARLLRDK